METSPSQSAAQGGGAKWSRQTGYPTAVTDCFHQGGSRAHRGNAHRGTPPAEPIFICRRSREPGLSGK